MSIKETKKRIKNTPSGRLWSEHIRFWMVDSVNLSNNYRGISRNLVDFDISELSSVTGISKKIVEKVFCNNFMKYPRTYHLPFSPGATSDDKRLQDGWFDFYKGKEVVFTEKLDGENTAMNCVDVYARSHGAPTRSPWSRNLWDSSDGLYWKVKNLIGQNETVYGENLYGEHSIHYDALDAYWYIFAANDGNLWYSWDEVKEFAKILDVPHVPELERCVLMEESEVKEIIDELMKTSSYYGWCEREGIVMRLVDSFPIMEFQHCVCKYVRANHVQTDEHWTKNWKKAKLYDENIKEWKEKNSSK